MKANKPLVLKSENAANYIGIAASPGWAIARAHVLTSHALTVTHHHVAPTDVSAEQARLQLAFEAAHNELNQLQLGTKLHNTQPELAAVLEVHRLMLADPVLYDAALDYIASHQANAAWALSEQVQVLAQSFERMENPYFRERALDVHQVGQRVLQHLLLENVGSVNHALDTHTPIVLVAQDLAPAEFAQWQHVALAGIVTAVGGVSSHTAIVARAHGLPAVLGVAGAADVIADGALVAMNGATGELWVNPNAEQLAQLQQQHDAWHSENKRQTAQVLLPATTACGTAVQVYANIETPADMPAVLAAGLDGVGLMRSEFLFMGRNILGRDIGFNTLPSEDEQTAAYSAVVQALAGKPATIRTLDVGADKVLNPAHAQDIATQQNPALGLRAVRYCLANPELFLTQLRALLRAAAHGPVAILLPMISSAAEVLACRAHLTTAREQLQRSGTPHGAMDAVSLGVMIEIPAAAIAIDTLLPHIDFCSVGTNDLIQYTLAIDRNDPAVAALYDPRHPAVLQLLSYVFERCAAAGKHVTVCGEMAGDATLTAELLNLGLRRFSVNPSQSAAVKAAIRQTTLRS